MEGWVGRGGGYREGGGRVRSARRHAPRRHQRDGQETQEYKHTWQEKKLYRVCIVYIYPAPAPDFFFQAALASGIFFRAGSVPAPVPRGQKKTAPTIG